MARLVKAAETCREMASTSTVPVALLLAYPLAYAIAFKAGKWRHAMLLAVVAPFFTTYLIRTISWVTILSDESPVVSVLYFDNDTRDPELGYLADGITESVISSLSGIEGLDVVSRGGAEQFRGSTAPTDAALAAALAAGLRDDRVAGLRRRAKQHAWPLILRDQVLPTILGAR